MRVKIQDARLVWRKHNLDWVKDSASFRAVLIGDLLDEGASKAVHDAALVVMGRPIAEDLISVQHCPVLLEPVSLCLEEARTLHKVSLLLTL